MLFEVIYQISFLNYTLLTVFITLNIFEWIEEYY
jgi:hypothetical protein